MCTSKRSTNDTRDIYMLEPRNRSKSHAKTKPILFRLVNCNYFIQKEYINTTYVYNDWHEGGHFDPPALSFFVSWFLSPRGILYKTQWAWQCFKLTQLMLIFASKKVSKFFDRLTKSDPKRTRRQKYPPSCQLGLMATSGVIPILLLLL